MNPEVIRPRQQVLDAASAGINGPREQDYGDPVVGFTRTAKLWEQILGTPVTPEQVALCMAALKIARLVETPSHQDSWVDIAGYAALGGEVAQRGVQK